MQNFWDERYSSADYVYGVEPDAWFKKFIDATPPGKILLPGEGEGRNAVYAALSGFDVHAFDGSMEGRAKAMSLAEKNHVKVKYTVSDAMEYAIDLEGESFDMVALVFFHLPQIIRTEFHREMIRVLKPGGKLYIMGFGIAQMKYNSGGPRMPEMLYDEDDLKQDFYDMDIISLKSFEDDFGEGIFHSGTYAAVELIASKPPKKQ